MKTALYPSCIKDGDFMKTNLFALVLTCLLSLSAQARDGVIDTIQFGLRLSPEATQVLRDYAVGFGTIYEFNEKHISIGQIITKDDKVQSLFVNFRIELAPEDGDPGRTLFCDGILVPKEEGAKVTWSLTGQGCEL